MQTVLLLNDHRLARNVNTLLRAFGIAELAADTDIRNKVALLHFLRAAKGKAGTLNGVSGEIKPFTAALIDDKDGQCASGCRIRVDLVHVRILFKQPGQQLAAQLPHLSANGKGGAVHGVCSLHAG